MSETTAEYRVRREKNDYTPKTSAQWGLEILKRSVLEVLYQQSLEVGDSPLRSVSQKEIRQRLGLQHVGTNNDLVRGVLEYLKEEEAVEYLFWGRGHWAITPDGISLIEGKL